MIVDSCHDPNRQPLGLEYLKGLGVNIASDVGVIVSTHWHDDHIRGLSDVVKEAISAELNVSGAMREKQFLLLIEAMKATPALAATGIDEWTKILGELRRRQQAGTHYVPPKCIVGERRIFNRAEDKAAGIPECEVWTLSPSDESFFSARANFENLQPKPGQTPGRLASLGPNHTSIVIWIRFGEDNVLLGADLEEVGSMNAGWTAVVNSKTRPQSRAKIFKIPHHGSANGHNPQVWTDMTGPEPISLISPFVHGKTILPKEADITRIRGYSKDCFVTTEPKVAKTRRKKSRLADRAMLMQVKGVQDIPFGTGHIRLRKTSATNWDVHLSGTATRLQ